LQAIHILPKKKTDEKVSDEDWPEGNDLNPTFGFVPAPDVLTGPFGTKEKPVKVPSHYPIRVVGCTGGPGELGHELLWHEVRDGRPLICLECGQWFVHEKLGDYTHYINSLHHH